MQGPLGTALDVLLIVALFAGPLLYSTFTPRAPRPRCPCGRRATQPNTLCRRHRHVVGWYGTQPLYGLRMTSKRNRPGGGGPRRARA